MAAPANVSALKALKADNPGRYTHSQFYADSSVGFVFAVPARAVYAGADGELHVKLLGDSTVTVIYLKAGSKLENLSLVEIDFHSTALNVTVFW